MVSVVHLSLQQGGGGGGGSGAGGEKKKKETILSQDMGKFLEKRVRVKFQGGREGKWQCWAIPG